VVMFCWCFENRPENSSLCCSSDSMASTRNTKGFMLVRVRDEALRLVLETCEYVFLNAKVLQKAYNMGYVSYSPTRRKCSRKGKSIV
jgi:hypothetical protein